jgi:hypothetical protein
MAEFKALVDAQKEQEVETEVLDKIRASQHSLNEFGHKVLL